MTVLSEVFWTFLITSVIGLIIGLARMAYKSKCKEVSCCCIKIVRDVDVEEREAEMRIQQTTVDNTAESVRL
jgi:hypothetical protein